MAVSEKIIAEAAERLWQAEQICTPCKPVRDIIPEHDIASAYAIQQLNIDRHSTAGRRIISGRKIGLGTDVTEFSFGLMALRSRYKDGGEHLDMRSGY